MEDRWKRALQDALVMLDNWRDFATIQQPSPDTCPLCRTAGTKTVQLRTRCVTVLNCTGCALTGFGREPRLRCGKRLGLSIWQKILDAMETNDTSMDELLELARKRILVGLQSNPSHEDILELLV